MTKSEKHIVNELISSTYIQTEPLFTLANQIENTNNLRKIKNNYLLEEQKDLLVTFLQNSNVKTNNLSDAKLIEKAKKKIHYQLKQLCESVKNFSVPEKHSFAYFNTVFYKEISKYLKIIEPGYELTADYINDIQQETVKTLMNDLKNLNTLFGNIFGFEKHDNEMMTNINKNKEQRKIETNINTTTINNNNFRRNVFKVAISTSCVVYAAASIYCLYSIPEIRKANFCTDETRVMRTEIIGSEIINGLKCIALECIKQAQGMTLCSTQDPDFAFKCTDINGKFKCNLLARNPFN
jgi:hypothetical protein